jgi:hypothetical protein
MKTYSALAIGAWAIFSQPLLAQTFFAPPNPNQPQVIPRKNSNQNSTPNLTPGNKEPKSEPDLKKDTPKVEEISTIYRDLAISLVDRIPGGEAVPCNLTIQIRNLVGNLVNTTTPWKCRLTGSSSGTKQLETVLFEKLAESGKPGPEKLAPTYVVIMAGARPNTQTAMSRPRSQPVPQRFLMPFTIEGSFGVAAN